MKRIKIFLSSIVEKSVHHVMINKKLKLTPEEIPKIRFIVAFQHKDTKTYLTSMVSTFLLKKMFHMKNKKRMIVLKKSPNSQEKRAKLIDRSIWNKTNPFTKLISYVKSQVKWKPIRFHMKKTNFFWENFIWNQIIFHTKNWLFLKNTKIDLPHNINYSTLSGGRKSSDWNFHMKTQIKRNKIN